VVNSRKCECGDAMIYFRTEDAGKSFECPMCGREYVIFVEYDESDDKKPYDIFAEPTQELLME
jgi:hypothetical protein